MNDDAVLKLFISQPFFQLISAAAAHPAKVTACSDLSSSLQRAALRLQGHGCDLPETQALLLRALRAAETLPAAKRGGVATTMAASMLVALRAHVLSLDADAASAALAELRPALDALGSGGATAHLPPLWPMAMREVFVSSGGGGWVHGWEDAGRVFVLSSDAGALGVAAGSGDGVFTEVSVAQESMLRWQPPPAPAVA